MNFRKAFQEQDDGIQMAPMIDIMFLLVIFLMVAWVYATWETKMEVVVPTAETSIPATRTPVELIVNIDKAGAFFVNNTEVDAPRLEHLLRQISVWEGHPVIIRADKQTDYEAVIKVLDICRSVDIWNVSFATLPPSDN